MKLLSWTFTAIILTLSFISAIHAQENSNSVYPDSCNISTCLTKGNTSILVGTYATLSDSSQVIGILWIYDKLTKKVIEQGWKNCTGKYKGPYVVKILIQPYLYDIPDNLPVSYYRPFFDIQLKYFLGENDNGLAIDIIEIKPSAENENPPNVADETVRATMVIMNTVHEQVLIQHKNTANKK